MPKAMLLCGVPTSGKSTYAEKVIEQDDNWKTYVILNTDHYIDLYAKQHNKTYNEVYYDALRTSLSKTTALLKFALTSNKNIIWDQTNLTPSRRKEKLSTLPPHYEKIAVYFEISLEKALERNYLRKLEGKELPTARFKSIYRSFQPPTVIEGFDYIECSTA